MQEEQLREVTIVYEGVPVSYKVGLQLSIQQMINLMAYDQHYIRLMEEAFDIKGMTFVSLDDPQATQVRLNSETAEYRNKNLKLSQFSIHKRLKFYLCLPESRKQLWRNPKGSAAKQYQKDLVIIGIVNTGNEVGKRVSIDLNNKGKFQMVDDVIEFLRQQMGLGEKTWFLFKGVHQQVVYTDLKAGMNFKKFIRANGIREMHAMPVYDAG